MLKVTVCVSGGGTNLQAILDRISDGTIKDVEIGAVYSNNPGAFALERARKAGIRTLVLSPKTFDNREAFNKAFLSAIEGTEPDLIVLAGCLVAIPDAMVRRYRGCIINIHPSLIPSFCGKGFYGLKVHEKALERGVRVSGATVHFVDEGTDTGPIILQKAVEVRQEDSPEVLQKRVMEEAEWVILPRAIDLIAHGKVHLEGRKVLIED